MELCKGDAIPCSAQAPCPADPLLLLDKALNALGSSVDPCSLWLCKQSLLARGGVKAMWMAEEARGVVQVCTRTCMPPPGPRPPFYQKMLTRSLPVELKEARIQARASEWQVKPEAGLTGTSMLKSTSLLVPF